MPYLAVIPDSIKTNVVKNGRLIVVVCSRPARPISSRLPLSSLSRTMAEVVSSSWGVSPHIEFEDFLSVRGGWFPSDKRLPAPGFCFLHAARMESFITSGEDQRWWAKEETQVFHRQVLFFYCFFSPPLFFDFFPRRR